MAGDWIKMRIDLQSHPKIVRILSEHKTDKFRVVGGLHAVWSVFDTHSEDGVLNGYSPEALDHVIGWNGFSASLVAIGWLENIAGGLVMPEFCEHNGKSGKRRAEDQKRKRESRKDPQPVRNSSADEQDEKLTREEKRREEDKDQKTCSQPQASTGLGAQFDGMEFSFSDQQLLKWKDAYPNTDVDAEIKKAAVWAAANPAKAKKNWARFLNTWIAKVEQNRGPAEGSCPVDKIIELYHRECPSFSVVAVTTDKALRSAIVERWNESEAHRKSPFWVKFFRKAGNKSSVFYRGENCIPRLEALMSRAIFREIEEAQ